MAKKESVIQTLKELEIMMHIGNEVIKQLKKANPNINIGKPYSGKYLPFILEYVNLFIVPDVKYAIKSLDDEELKSELWLEAFYIESFCRWLDEEKNIIPKKIVEKCEVLQCSKKQK